MRMRFALLLCLSAGCVSTVTSADVDLDVRPAVAEHREHITESPHTFTVKVDAEDLGTFCRYSVVDDVMQWVSIEGRATNPKLLVPGMPDLSSADALLKSILKPGMTDFEKALAIHTVVARFSVYTSCPGRNTWGTGDPIIAMNNLAGICGHFTVWANALARKAGLPARTFEITHHTVPEFFYDGRWHMFDPTTRTFFIGRDNRQVGSVRELERSLDLIRRAGARARIVSYFAAPQDNFIGGSSGSTGWRMDVALRPGETLKRLSDKDGPSLWNYPINRRPQYATAFLTFKPDLAKHTPDELRITRSNVIHDAARPVHLKPDKPDVPAQATFTVRSPHPITKATLTGRFGRAGGRSMLRAVVTAYAPGMTTWPATVFVADKPGINPHTIDLTPHVFGAYGYDVRFEMSAAKPGEATGITSADFDTILQLNRYSLPHLNGGTNTITYVDDGESRDVTVVYNFREKHPITNRPWPAIPGRENVLSVTVRNRGTEAVENVPVAIEQRWVKEPLKKTVTIPRIAPGASAVVEVPWTPARWRTHCFRVRVDPDDRIRETDEENNVFERIFRAFSPADLAVTSSQVTVDKKNGRARLEALLTNIGGRPAREVDVLFATGDGKAATPIGHVTVPVVHAMSFATENINPFAWATLEVDAAKLTGTHVQAVVDPDGKLDESKRDNNRVWVALADAAPKPPWTPPKPDPFVFYSFEGRRGRVEDGETERLVEAVEVEDHATLGRLAAKLTFAAKGHSEFRLVADGRDVRMPRDWTGFKRLQVDAFSDSDGKGLLILRLRTLKPDGRQAEHDAFFELPSRKAVTVEVPLDRLAGGGLRAVDRLVFMGNGTVFLDNLRLSTKPAGAELKVVLPGRVVARDRVIRTTHKPKRIPLSSEEDLLCFSSPPPATIAEDFGAPGVRRAAKFEIRSGRSVGMTLDLTRKGCPWPSDWSGLRVLRFQARRRSETAFMLGFKLRSSHPERGVRTAGTLLALRADGASHVLDLKQFADRVDLAHMTHVTWYVWKPKFTGTFWIGDLRLE